MWDSEITDCSVYTCVILTPICKVDSMTLRVYFDYRQTLGFYTGYTCAYICAFKIINPYILRWVSHIVFDCKLYVLSAPGIPISSIGCTLCGLNPDWFTEILIHISTLSTLWRVDSYLRASGTDFGSFSLLLCGLWAGFFRGTLVYKWYYGITDYSMYTCDPQGLSIYTTYPHKCADLHSCVCLCGAENHRPLQCILVRL